MRYSNNLNIILKAIEKVNNYIARDLQELESLQSNSKSAEKFTNACYQKVKKLLADDLMKFQPQFNYYFNDGSKIINDEAAQYFFTIFPISGLENLRRASTDFCVGIALSYGSNYEESHAIAAAIKKIIPGEIFYCEKDFGAFLNGKRIKASKKYKDEKILVSDIAAFRQVNESNNNITQRVWGSKLLELAYLSCNRLDFLAINSIQNNIIKNFKILTKEAGIIEKPIKDWVALSNASLL